MRRCLPILVALLLLAACGERKPVPRPGPLGPELYEIAEDDRPTSGAFMRYSKPGAKGGGLDIAVTDYAHPEGLPPLSLVGVVHVADTPYFEMLSALLEEYEVVLYEAVIPEDQDIGAWQSEAREGLRSHSGFQQTLSEWFGFQYQLDSLDYTRPNFVHADMTYEAFVEAGGGEFLKKIADPLGTNDESLPQSVKDTLESATGLGEIAFGQPGPLRSMVRKMFAETMGTADIGDALDMLPGTSELVLVKRNEVAVAKFVEVMPEITGRVAIFYGAAHMPDLEKRILDLGYERAGGRWLRAWALRAPLKR